MYDRISDSLIYFFFEIVNSMNKNLIILNQLVLNTVFSE